MKVLVTGSTGQLGYDLIIELRERGYDDILGVGYENIDITDKEQVSKLISDYKPDIVFHCAAYTAVDKAEEEKELCNKVNYIGTKNIVDAIRNSEAKMIYISTDYVFNGKKEGLYEPEDSTDPVNYYGLTKRLGEEVVLTYPKSFIVRISWVFGINGKNFIKTMLRLAETQKEINVVSDQVGSPTYTKDLSRLLVDIAESDKYSIYHATNEGFCSWAEFAKYVFEVSESDVKVNPILTKEYPTKANRPFNSRMSKDKLLENGFKLLPTWQDATIRYIKELKK